MSGKSMSYENRLKNGRGKIAAGKEYKSGIKPREARSSGRSLSIPDPKFGRMVQVMSEGELRWYTRFWWDDEVVDINEQVFLDDERIAEICSRLEAHPRKGASTDFLVTKADGSKTAYSIKCDSTKLTDKEKIRFAIEKEYWNSMGIDFKVGFKDQIDRMMTNNILDVMSAWDIPSTADDFAVLRHLIARKEIDVDISKNIDYIELKKQYEKEISKWRTRC